MKVISIKKDKKQMYKIESKSKRETKNNFDTFFKKEVDKIKKV